MNDRTSALDSEELLHLALHSIQQNQTEKAIAQLKQLLSAAPDHGKAHYLLGALHAEIGMYDRAIEDMQTAVKLEPDLQTAHFQLGLLYLTSGRVNDAEAAWRPLDALDEQDPLFLFKRGMLQLVRDEFEACIEDLERGMTLNTSNPDLNNDMQNIIDSARRAMGAVTAVPDQASPPDSTADQSTGTQTLLAAYQRNNFTSH